MTVKLYRTISDPKRVSKSLTDVYTLSNVHPLDEVDAENPVFVVGGLAANYLENYVNYAYIPEWDHYYYVEPPIVDGRVTKIVLHEDYLMTFSTGIKGLEAVVRRQENLNDFYLDDPEFKVESYVDKRTIKFKGKNLMANNSYILTVLGGVEVQRPEGTGGDGGTRPEHEGGVILE